MFLLHSFLASVLAFRWHLSLSRAAAATGQPSRGLRPSLGSRRKRWGCVPLCWSPCLPHALRLAPRIPAVARAVSSRRLVIVLSVMSGLIFPSPTAYVRPEMSPFCCYTLLSVRGQRLSALPSQVKKEVNSLASCQLREGE